MFIDSTLVQALSHEHKFLSGDVNLAEINWNIPAGPFKFSRLLGTLRILIKSKLLLFLQEVITHWTSFSVTV